VGFDWAITKLQKWLSDAKELAAELGSPELLAYLAGREEMLLTQKEKVAAGLRSIATIVALKGA
jgi:hypothetical protein